MVAPLAGCGGDSGPPASTLGSLTGTRAPASADPSPGASGTTSSTPTLAAPVPDPRISERTAAGAEAAVRHYFEALDYAFATGDVAPLRAISDAGCVSCSGEIARITDIYSRGGRFVGGRTIVLSLQSSPVARDIETTLLVSVEVRASALSQFDSVGGLVQSYPGMASLNYRVAVAWFTTQWRVLAYSGVVS